MEGFFISKDAQIDLGILPADYPYSVCPAPEIKRKTPHREGSETHVTMDVSQVQPVPESNRPNKATADTLSLNAECGCLKRTSPPPKPTTIPFKPIPENRGRLKNG